MYDTIIIGKGPAGITAALYLKRANINCLIIGKDGGALEKASIIENYYGCQKINAKELLLKGINQAIDLGIKIETDEVVGISFNEKGYTITTRNNEYYSKSLILATGTSRKNPAIEGLEKFEGRGISYCAVCDAFFYRGKNVGVIGSGDYAIHEINELSPIVNTVTLLTNGEKLEAEIRDENLDVIETKIESFTGENNLEQVHFKDGTKKALDGIFLAIGTASTTDLAKKIGIILNDKSIVVDENMHTNIDGVFACGDCTGGIFQISKAVYQGTVAALETIQYLRRKE